MAKAATTTIVLKTDAEDGKRIQALIERTNKADPDPKDLALMTDALDRLPVLVSQIGNIQQTLRNSIIDGMTSNSGMIREALGRYVEAMKDELGYHRSSFVEKLLIEEVVTRWVRLQQMDHDHKQTTYREHSLNEGAYYERRLHLTQKRYLASIESLAKVRKLIARTQAAGVEMYRNLQKDRDEDDED